MHVLSPKYSRFQLFFSPLAAGLTNRGPVWDSDPGAPLPRTWVRDHVGGFYTKIQWGQECWDERKRMSKQILWRGSSKGCTIPPRSHTCSSQVPGTFEWWKLKIAEFGVWSNSVTNWVWNLHVDEFLALHHHHPHPATPTSIRNALQKLHFRHNKPSQTTTASFGPLLCQSFHVFTS